MQEQKQAINKKEIAAVIMGICSGGNRQTLYKSCLQHGNSMR